MKSDPTPLQLTKICLKQLGQVCLSTLFLLYNSTLLIYVINQRHTHTETTLSDWMKAAHYWIHNYLHPRYVYSILFQPVVLLRWHSDLIQSWFPFPLSQTDPYCGGRAVLAAVSQGPSSVADKHVCLQYADVSVCVHVCVRACASYHMTWVFFDNKARDCILNSNINGLIYYYHCYYYY